MRQSEYQGPVHDTSLKLQCTHLHVIEVTQRTPDVKNSNAWKKDFFFSFSKSKDGRTNYPLQYLQHKRCWG